MHSKSLLSGTSAERQFEMLWLKVEVGSGHISTAIKEAKEIAKRLGVGVEFDFNGVSMSVISDTDEAKSIEYFEKVISRPKASQEG